jgi:hypothetical protein
MRRSAHPGFVLLATVGSWLVVCASGRAQAKVAVAFEWSAPAGCPSATQVRAEIDQLLGAPIDESASVDLTVHAAVEQREQWLVTLDTHSGGTDGHRTFESATCQGLASATALIVALMIDPDAVAAQASKAKEAEPAPQPAPTATPAPDGPTLDGPAPATPTPEVPASAAPPPGPRTLFGIVGLGAAGHLGILPGADVGLAAQIGLLRGPWRIELRGAYGPHEVRSDPVADASNAYGKFRFWAATLAGCWMVARAWGGFGPCADIEVGVVHGEGVGSTKTTSAAALWYGMGAGAGLVVEATSWLHFPIHADAIVPWHRPNYIFENVDQPIFRAWPVGGRLTLAAEAQF